jgi:hypothetical protein
MTATVERMPARLPPGQPARVGDGFVIGSAVRTGPASRAKLSVGKRGKLDVEASSNRSTSRARPGVDRSDPRVETGIAELETGGRAGRNRQGRARAQHAGRIEAVPRARRSSLPSGARRSTIR